MRTIFEQGEFNAHSQVCLDESISPIFDYSQYGATGNWDTEMPKNTRSTLRSFQ